MAGKRPSSRKREREYQKRQRELRKAKKAAQKRERRFNRGEQDTSPLAEDAGGAGNVEENSPT